MCHIRFPLVRANTALAEDLVVLRKFVGSTCDLFVGTDCHRKDRETNNPLTPSSRHGAHTTIFHFSGSYNGIIFNNYSTKNIINYVVNTTKALHNAFHFYTRTDEWKICKLSFTCISCVKKFCVRSIRLKHHHVNPADDEC